MRNGRNLPTGIRKDTYNAPIPPLLDAAAISIPMRLHWDLDEGAPVTATDRAIVCMDVVFLLASLVVLYFIARELFDARLAAKATGLALICDMLWRYALSGLPQMFLLLVLHLNVFALLRAMRARYSNQPCLGWIAALGFGFGVMALTHALSIFIFVPVLVFSFFFFRPRGWAGLLMLAIFLTVYMPWLVRNVMVCGDFRGIAAKSILDGIIRPEAGHMRRFVVDLSSTNGNYFVENFRINLMAQINRLIEYLGWSCVAPLALVSVLHGFRRPITATFRWLMFAMWGSAVCGMALFGMKQEHDLAANQFYLLFVPLFICYGLAYALVQWDRRIGLGFILPQWTARARTHTVLRTLLVTVLFLLSGIPLLSRLFLDKSGWLVEWPPYLPPSIATLKKLFQPDEIIGSDMPWAVAWYADRDSLWLPFQPDDLIDLSDYRRLGEPVCGLYFTPISGSENTLNDLARGEYMNWWPYIVHTIDPEKTPYPYRLKMTMPDCMLYMDRNRLLKPAAPK
jgi:hypothetical protein